MYIQVLRIAKSEEFKKILKGVDKVGNGLITEEELMEAYKELYKSKEIGNIEFNLIKKDIKIDKPKLINYMELLNSLKSVEEDDKRKELRQIYETSVLFNIK